MEPSLIAKGLVVSIRKVKWAVGGVWGRFLLRLLGVQYGAGLKLGSPPFVHRSRGATIRLGDNVTIYNSLEENPAGISHRTALCASRPGAKLIIGNNVGISGAILCAWERVEIGDNVNIGAGATVYDTDYHPLNPIDRLADNHVATGVAPVKIGNNVWLGARSMVLKGVTIGEGAVVAAAAVVTKDVPPGVIVAGIPARIVGQVPPEARLQKGRCETR